MIHGRFYSMLLLVQVLLDFILLSFLWICLLCFVVLAFFLGGEGLEYHNIVPDSHK